MKVTTKFYLTSAAFAALLLCSCANVDTAGGPVASQHHKSLYAASYDDTGKMLAWAEFNLLFSDTSYLNIDSHAKQMAYINEQAHRFGVAEWRNFAEGKIGPDEKQYKLTTASGQNPVPPEVKQCSDECRQMVADMTVDHDVREHDSLRTAYDQAGARAVGNMVGALGGLLAGATGGASGLQVANAVVPVGTNGAIDASSSQDDISRAVSESASALDQKYSPEHSKMKATADALVQKYGTQYPDLLAAITAPVHRS